MDVAQAGGWSSLDALKQAYQQPDDARMLRVVEHETELREVPVSFATRPAAGAAGVEDGVTRCSTTHGPVAQLVRAGDS